MSYYPTVRRKFPVGWFVLIVVLLLFLCGVIQGVIEDAKAEASREAGRKELCLMQWPQGEKYEAAKRKACPEIKP